MESQIDSYRARWWAVARTRPTKSFVKPSSGNKDLAFRPHCSACSTCAIWSWSLWPSQLSAFLCGSYRKNYPRYGSCKPRRMFSHHVSRARHRTSIYTCFEIAVIRRNYYFWMHRTLSLIISSNEIFVVDGSVGGCVRAGTCWQICMSGLKLFRDHVQTLRRKETNIWRSMRCYSNGSSADTIGERRFLPPKVYVILVLARSNVVRLSQQTRG